MTRKTMRLALTSAAMASLSIVAAMVPAHAIAVGQIDSFASGTTENWIVGLLGAPHPTPPSVELGGPAGATDGFLKLTALGGSGPGSRLSVLNTAAQWAGSFSAAGVARISFDARNFGATDLTLRLLLSDPKGAPPANIATTEGILLPAGGGWTHLVFDVEAATLLALAGDAATLLSDVTELRIYHRALAPVPGDINIAQIVAGSLGVDNILAEGTSTDGTTIPAPASAALLATGLGMLVARRRTATQGR